MGNENPCGNRHKKGNILAFMDGGGTNIKSTPFHEVRQQIQQLLDSLILKIGATKSDISTIFLCVAGGDRQEDIKRWKAWIAPMFPSASCKVTVTVTNDAVAALTSGTFTREGLVVIAGTGSIVYAVQQNSISRMGDGVIYWEMREVATILDKRHCVPLLVNMMLVVYMRMPFLKLF